MSPCINGLFKTTAGIYLPRKPGLCRCKAGMRLPGVSMLLQQFCVKREHLLDDFPAGKQLQRAHPRRLAHLLAYHNSAAPPADTMRKNANAEPMQQALR